MKSIFKAVALVTIFSVVTRALGFFFRIYLSRKINAVGLGLFQMATSILGIFMTLISSGLPLTTAKLVSKYETNNQYNKRNKAVTSSLIIAIFLSISSCVIIVLLNPFWKIILTNNTAVDILLALTPSIIFSAVYSIFRGALWGQNDYFNCGLTELIEQIIRFILTFIMLYSITDIYLATKYSAYAFNITCLLSAIIVCIIYLRKAKLNFKFGEYKHIIKSATPVTGVKLANSLVQPLTTLIMPTMLILAGYTSAEAIASYGVVMGMTFPLLFVPMTVIGSISMVLIPAISSMLVKKEFKAIENNITTALEVSCFISMLFVPLYLSVGNLIGIVIYNNHMSGVLLQSAAICVLPITLCNLTGSILDALNLETKAFKNYLIGSALLFVSLIALTPLIGISAVIVSFFVSMSTISLLNLHMIKKQNLNFKFNLLKTSFKYFLIVAPCSLLGNFISNILLHFFTDFFAGLMGGGVAVTATLLLCYAFNIYNLTKIKDILLKRKKLKTE